jgi:hypothetical protein
MPRIFSRHELLPQVKQCCHVYSKGYGSSSVATSSSGSINSPTISKFPSSITATRKRRSQNVGLSYMIADRNDEEDQRLESRVDVDTTPSWGYFVDFNSPQQNNIEHRKSSSKLQQV